MINVILCGGSGTRLWPISRDSLPKQFHKILDKHTLFQKTVLRNVNLASKLIIVLNQELYFVAIDQLNEIGVDDYEVIIEEEGRDTAGAIALASLYVEEHFQNENILVTPSDHIIEDEESYSHAVSKALEFSKNDMVVFGITPSCVETGYGYIERINDNDVKRFIEKPDNATAEVFLKEDTFYWNSGMFLFKSSLYLEELKINANDVFTSSKKIYSESSPTLRFKKEQMRMIPKISIDYAVMEKSNNLKMVYGDFGWSDLGSFDSIYKLSKKDENNNCINSKGILLNSKNNFFDSKRTVCAIDIDDLIIIDTEDALLVSKVGSTQKVKQVVEKLKEQNNSIIKYHTEVYRPWGHYKILEESENYKIKKIVVNPNGKLSLQKHQHRSEHWVIVSGKAIVTKENNKYTINKNESIFISPNEIHRIENNENATLEIIEVQVGDYLGEDDIIRIDDIYDR